MSKVLAVPPSEGAELLYALMQVLYLSPACASGNHEGCQQVDEYSSLVCCCPECVHVDLTAAPPATATTPLLHLVNSDDDRTDRHIYLADGSLGVRADLVHALEKVLSVADPHSRHEETAVRLGIAACLVFAPRRL